MSQSFTLLHNSKYWSFQVMGQVKLTAAKLECGNEELFFGRSSWDDRRNRQFTDETHSTTLNDWTSESTSYQNQFRLVKRQSYRQNSGHMIYKGTWDLVWSKGLTYIYIYISRSCDLCNQPAGLSEDCLTCGGRRRCDCDASCCWRRDFDGSWEEQTSHLTKQIIKLATMVEPQNWVAQKHILKKSVNLG